MGAGREVEVPRATAIASCLAYSCCSISMVVANKAILSSYEFNYHMVLLFFQTGCSFALTIMWAKLGYFELEPFDMKIAMKWFPVNLLFLGMLFSGYLSLQLLTVPMMTIFKNLTNCLVLGGEWYFLGNPSSKGVMASLGLMILGAVLSGLSDVHFSPKGYTWMALNCCCTASYLLYMRTVMKTTKLSKAQMSYYNSLLGMPVILVASVLMGDLPAVFSAPQLSQPGFIFAACFSGCIGFGLSLAALWCISSTSATTYSMVGACNKIPLAILGVVMFNNPLTLKLAVFVGLGLSGGIMFSYVKAREAEAKRRATLPTTRV